MGTISNRIREQLGYEFDDHFKPTEETEEQKLAAQEYAKKLKASETVQTPFYIAENLYNFTRELIKEKVEKAGRKFEEDGGYIQLHKFISCYFASDERFKDAKFINNPSLKKGLFLYGTVGYGKTSLLKAFRTMAIRGNSFGYRSCYEVKEMLEIREKKIADVQALYNSPMLFDELGKEAKSFGAELMTDVIARRYDNFIDKDIKTHITTNLSPSEIGRRYGKHIESRLYEMFNVIHVKGNDKRK
jgi:DNA replication protein DnaC